MDKQQIAIKRLQEAALMSERYYEKPLCVKYSGGKDSDVLLRLAEKANIRFTVEHDLTTVDSPITYYFVRETFECLERYNGISCKINKPVYKGNLTSMWGLIPQMRIPPTRLARYCCRVMKESHNKDKFIATGVRWDESTNRAKNSGLYQTSAGTAKIKRFVMSNDNDDKRLLFERCEMKGAMTVNPIIDWTDKDVWDYINDQRILYNPLYGDGFKRIGCIGCPMAGKHRKEQFERWPKYKTLYLHAFDRMLKARKAKGLETQWQTAQEVFDWWISK